MMEEIIAEQKKRIYEMFGFEEEKKCEDCKWYGFSCECPHPCRSDTKQFWEKAKTEGES